MPSTGKPRGRPSKAIAQQPAATGLPVDSTAAESVASVAIIDASTDQGPDGSHQSPAPGTHDSEPVVTDDQIQESPTAGPNVAASTQITIGGATGSLFRIPTDVILGTLADVFGARLAAMRNTPAVLALVPQVSATEGRCAPIIFTIEEGQPPALFAGVESVAAAIAAGIETVSVIIVSSSEAGALQSYLAARASGQSDSPLYTEVAAEKP